MYSFTHCHLVSPHHSTQAAPRLHWIAKSPLSPYLPFGNLTLLTTSLLLWFPGHHSCYISYSSNSSLPMLLLFFHIALKWKQSFRLKICIPPEQTHLFMRPNTTITYTELPKLTQARTFEFWIHISTILTRNTCPPICLTGISILTLPSKNAFTLEFASGFQEILPLPLT